MVNETKPYDLENEKLQNSRDYKEITLIITILAGISAFLLKLIDYFNSNIITISDHVQFIIYLMVYLSLIEILLIFSFLTIKGYFLSTDSENEQLKNFAKRIFQYIFIIPIPIIIILISTLLFYAYAIDENKYYNYIFIVYWSITVLFAFFAFIYLDPNIATPNLKNKKYIHFILQIIPIPIITFIFISSLILPSYLMVGHYSIEVFQESNNDADMLTFTIEETGITYTRCFITVYKLNLNNNSLEYMDEIIIPTQNESKNKLMFGGIHELYYYLNVNTSTLSPGNYMLHAEVTNDLSKQYNFGTIKKHDDKLFYIESKNTNVSSY